MRNLLAFLKKRDLGAAPSLRQLSLKTKFYLFSRDFACSTVALQGIVDEGFTTLMEELVASGAAPVELWFHTMQKPPPHRKYFMRIHLEEGMYTRGRAERMDGT